ncbi:MAG: carbohydrate porin [Planctomycetota bacterium]
MSNPTESCDDHDYQNGRAHQVAALLIVVMTGSWVLPVRADPFSFSACDAPPAPSEHCCDDFLSCLADSGVRFGGNLTQFYFGTADGGAEQTDRYGGHGDYVANFDLGALGLHEGLLLKVRAEHRFGRSITEPTGAILPATTAADLPVRDSRELVLSNVLFTQFLSERFAVFAGKLDTLDGDQNAYASGRGITQFSNVAFVATPIALRTIPYASLGCGFAILDGAEPIFNFTLMNPTDTVETDGFSELFAEGVAIAAELRVPTNLFSRPGHQLLAATWSSREFVALDQDPRIILPSIPIEREEGSWSAYWNMDQALWVDDSDPTRHWGMFARAGLADQATNPISYFLSGGIGGASPLRVGDTFGIGYFFSGTSNDIAPFLEAVLGPIGDGQGVECFYQTQISPSISVTPDIQWLSQARSNLDDAIVLGIRTNISF